MIHNLLRWICGLALVLAATIFVLPVPSTANPVATDNVQAQLISEVTAIQPGTSFWVALHLKIREGWHTYWINPGDTGMATGIEWTLPASLEAGEIVWPYPERIPYGPLMNYGYHDDVYLLTEIKVRDGIPVTGPLQLQADTRWLACEDICIPEDAVLTLTLPMTGNTPPIDERWVEAFSQARQALPRSSPWPASFSTTADTITLDVAASDLKPEWVKDIAFFPLESGVIKYDAPQEASIDEQGIHLKIKRDDSQKDTVLRNLQGVLVFEQPLDDTTAMQAFNIDAPSATALPIPAPPHRLEASMGKELIFAFLGGIILNLMPCVFPILSMKALSLVQHCEKRHWQIRLHGIMFTLGVLACFAVIAGILIALRAGGSQIGWGFQLQSPVFVTLLAYMMFAVGLSLSGVFSIGNSLMGVGNSLAAHAGYMGSFATGALATLVATPCTAPFMGAALGYALTQPWHASLAIFQALGLGLAFPYLLLTFNPALFRYLPRPGVWMERLKEFLAFPMYATTAWLVWVLTLQTGSTGIVAALAGMILIAFAAWVFQSSRAAGPRWHMAGNVGAVMALVVALVLLRLPVVSNEAESASSHGGKSGKGPPWEPFSSLRLEELRAEKHPVFVNFTAAWCITCLANERIALSSARMGERFAEAGIMYLKGDWTNRNAEITQVLSSFGRSGVPLYIYYPAGADEPITLPQILTETTLLDHLGLVHSEELFQE